MAKKKATVQSVNAQIEALEAGQTLLVQVLKTSNPDKVQLEFAEKTRGIENSPSALLGLLNASDDRFSSGARRAWKTAQIVDVAKLMNINCGDDASWVTDPDRGKEVLPLGILNPTIMGYRCRVQILETVEPTEYQADNVETSAKRKGAEGEHILHNGQYIFSNTEVTLIKGDEAPTHVTLEADTSKVGVGAGIVDEVPGI